LQQGDNNHHVQQQPNPFYDTPKTYTKAGQQPKGHQTQTTQENPIADKHRC
jgi:hypothetical protein